MFLRLCALVEVTCNVQTDSHTLSVLRCVVLAMNGGCVGWSENGLCLTSEEAVIGRAYFARIYVVLRFYCLLSFLVYFLLSPLFPSVRGLLFLLF